jgi:microcystin degradation protein MlrC
MRIALGRLFQSTNSFALSRTDRSHFESREIRAGRDVVQGRIKPGTVLGGALAAAATYGIEIVPRLDLSAPPGGPLDSGAFDVLVEEFCGRVAEATPTVDATVIELSGALVVDDGRPGDEIILERLRSSYGDRPLVAVLSAHANVTPRIVELCDVVLDAGFGDPTREPEQGARAIEFARVVTSGSEVRSAYHRLPLLPSYSAILSDRRAVRGLVELARDAGASAEVLAASIFGGFPFADVPHAGMSVVVTTSGGLDDVQSWIDEIASRAWDGRQDLLSTGLNVEEAVHRAMESREKPVVLADLGDDPGAGAPGDGTTILWALLDLGARSAVVGPVADRLAVGACFDAGAGSSIETSVGGQSDTRHGFPIDVRGTVTWVGDGQLTLSGPIAGGITIDLGRMAVIQAIGRHEGSVEIVLAERPAEAFDLQFFRHVGIDVEQKQIVALKSSGRYRWSFGSIASEMIDVVTPGITTPDPRFFEYRNVRRPIFPLDSM